MSESNDGKILSEFFKMIGFCEADAGYNPTNPLLLIAAMTAQHTAGVAAVNDIPVKIVPYKVAVNERQQAFEGIAAYAVGIRNIAKASGASKEMLADMLTYTRKLRGSRAGEGIVDDPNTPENEALNSHSVSQRSYEAQESHFRNLVELAKVEPTYGPNENEMKISTLDAYIANLAAKNAAVASMFIPLSNARALRDGLLYTNEDSIVAVALLCKAYVRGALGADSTLYQQIKDLEFERPYGKR